MWVSKTTGMAEGVVPPPRGDFEGNGARGHIPPPGIEIKGNRGDGSSSFEVEGNGGV